VAGVASVANEPPFDRRIERFLGDTARFACHAARSAVSDAGLDPARLRAPDAGAVIGSGTGSLAAYDEAMDLVRAHGAGKAGPYTVPRAMSSTCSAAVAHAFGVEGVTYSPSSACTTSALAIGQAMRLIESGAQNIVLAGGSDELHDGSALLFGAMGVVSHRFNDVPGRASRPYDESRDGFVLASGAGVLVLESLDHALARGARIHGEITGFGQATDGADMVAPRRRGIARAIRAAANGRVPGYVNTHAPSTPLGDIEELGALTDVFGSELPPFSSVKGLTGHPLGASGAHEAIYTLLMIERGWLAGTPNLDARDPATHGLPLVVETRQARLRDALSVSFGFGGVAACLAFAAYHDQQTF
jgi:3-oxoacyl-[acyl-carrier-protein] synthase-1